MRRYSKTARLLISALFAALTAVCSFISIPLPFTPVPVNLATLSVFLAGGLLGWRYGTISQMVYLLLGAVGVPVFHNFTAGLGFSPGRPAAISSVMRWRPFLPAGYWITAKIRIGFPRWHSA